MVDAGQFIGPSVSAVSPLISAVVDTWLKPKITELIKARKLNTKLYDHYLESSFIQYLENAFRDQSSLRTLLSQGKPMLLEEVYLPLTIKSFRDKEAILIDSYRKELLPHHDRILLTDRAGMGKSTVLRYLFLCCIRENAGHQYL